MNSILRRRRGMMGAKTDGNWINILPHTDWTNQDGFAYFLLRSITNQMLPTNNAPTVIIPCPFSLNGSYASWARQVGFSEGAAGIIVRGYDQNGNYLGDRSKWGGDTTTTVSLLENTAYIRVTFQRGPTSAANPDDWVLYHPLMINSISYNTEFNGQKVKA